MEKTIILLAAALLVTGIQYDGLRVKFGWSDALADIEYFYTIPRTISEVETEGWQRTERPPGPLPELRMYCPPGRGVCPLYDTAGFVAGLMIAIPVDEFDSPPIKPEKKFVKWQAPASIGEPSREYWTATQYFVSEVGFNRFYPNMSFYTDRLTLDLRNPDGELNSKVDLSVSIFEGTDFKIMVAVDVTHNNKSLKAGAGPQVENGATLQDGGVWVSDLDGRLMRIPSTEAELNSTAFKKQNCIPNMGIHYYYNMTRNLKCEDMLPWFALTTQGDLVGTGFQVIGKLPRQKHRDWFETIPSPKQGVQVTIPFAPSCLTDWAEKYGVLSMHIYFTNDPWNIKCITGDSIQPAPPLDRIILNGYKYMNKITDEVYKIFNG